MKRGIAMTGMLRAAIIVVVLLLAPSLAKAHGDHDHHSHAMNATIDVTPAERQASLPA